MTNNFETYHPPIEEAVYEALGAASMCWEHIEKAGIFDSTRAREWGEWLLEEIDFYKKVEMSNWQYKQKVRIKDGGQLGCIEGFLDHSSQDERYIHVSWPVDGGKLWAYYSPSEIEDYTAQSLIEIMESLS